MESEKQTTTEKIIEKNNNYNKIAEKKPSGKKQLLYFCLILLFGAIFVILMKSYLNSEQWSWYWKLTVIYFIPPAGKETVIPAGLGVASSFGLGVKLPVNIWALSIWVFDILACLAIITNWWLLELLIEHIPGFPFIGIRRKKPHFYKTKISLKKWYHGLHKKTQALEAKKYGKLLPIALFIFMFIPFQGTGAMSTTVIGTWIGLKKFETILIVTFGSLLSIIVLIIISLGILAL